jgi:hypothetical protein
MTNFSTNQFLRSVFLSMVFHLEKESLFDQYLDNLFENQATIFLLLLKEITELREKEPF